METLKFSFVQTTTGLEVIKGHRDQFVASLQATIDNQPFKEDDNIKSWYCFAVYESILLVDKSLERLRQSILHYSVLEIPEYFDHLDLKPEDFYTYHLENFYIRYASVSDLMAHLVNKSLRLGYKDRFCNLDKILENTTIEKDLKRQLGKLKSMMEKKKRVRNKILHQGVEINDQVSHKSPSFFETGIESTEEVKGIDVDPKLADYFKGRRKKKIDVQHAELTEQHKALWKQCEAIIKSLSILIAHQLRIIQIEQDKNYSSA